MYQPSPNFFIVGASKSGTTALATALLLHPQIFMSDVKELNFFNKFEAPDAKISEAELKAYLNHFKSAGNEKIIGEASVSYFSCNKAAHWLCNFFPKAKILITIRNPLERTVSMYEMYRRDGYKKSFDYAIETDGFLVQQNLYLERTKRYLDTFPADQLLIILHDDLKNNWSTVTTDILKFLDLDGNISIPKVNRNIGGVPKNRFLETIANRRIIQYSKRIIPRAAWGPIDSTIKQVFYQKFNMTKNQKQYLIGQYREDVEEMGNILNLDLCEKWLT